MILHQSQTIQISQRKILKNYRIAICCHLTHINSHVPNNHHLNLVDLLHPHIFVSILIMINLRMKLMKYLNHQLKIQMIILLVTNLKDHLQKLFLIKIMKKKIINKLQIKPTMYKHRQILKYKVLYQDHYQDHHLDLINKTHRNKVIQKMMMIW